MEGHHFKEDFIDFYIPYLPKTCSTYYKIYGNLQSGLTPVVILHGGPGAGHEYLLTFAELWRLYDIPVVFYDQIGCASSTHLPETSGDTSFWNEDLFVAELDNLLDSLQLREGPGFHLFGHSWGGRLAAAYASRQPRGLDRLVLASGLASTELAIRGRWLLVEKLPPDVARVMKEEGNGDVESEEYLDAQKVFNQTFFCRSDPFPPEELQPAMKNIAEDKTVQMTMHGLSTMNITGSLQGWTCISRLPNITATTLVYNGEYDTSHDVATAPFFEHIPRVRWTIIANGGHMCHLEKGLQQKVLELVGEFLIETSKDIK